MRSAVRLSFVLGAVLLLAALPVLLARPLRADVTIQKIEQPGSDPVTAGTDLTYTINVINSGPDTALNLMWSDMLPAGTRFVSLVPTPGWTCNTPTVGSVGTVSCSIGSQSVGTSPFTLTVHVNPGVAAGTVLSNTANVTTTTADDPSDNSATETTTVAALADLSITKVDDPDPVSIGMVSFGTPLTYTIAVTNEGPSNAATVSFSDTLPAGTTFRFLSSPGWTCVTPAEGAHGQVSCSTPSLAPGTATFALGVRVDNSLADGTVLSNTVTVMSTTADPSPGNESATATTLVASVDMELALTKSDSPDPVLAGGNITYTITASNTSSKSIDGAALVDFMPAGTTFVSITAPVGWNCSTPPAGGTGSIGCTASPWPQGSVAFTLVLQVASSVPGGTILDNEANLGVVDGDNHFIRFADATTTVASPASLSGTKTVTGTFQPGGSVVYTVVLTNTGGIAQGDNPGDELTDVLPAGLTLVSATATSGTAVATVGTNTVTWNGSIPASGSVTITITATINSGIAPGTTITNQGNFSYDADGNGTNEASGVTDNPATAPGSDATSFVVAPGAVAGPANIPTLDEVGLALLILLLAMGGAVMLRRRRQA